MVNVKLSRQVELHSSKAILEMWCLVWHDFHWPTIGLDGSSPSPASNIWVPAALLPHLTPESPLGSNSWIKPDKDCCCCLVAQSCLTLCDLMDCSTPGFPVLHHLPELAQTYVHWVSDDELVRWVMPSTHLILCHPLLLLPSIFPNIRVFSNESALHVRWLKYWSLNFSVSPSNELSGLISFRIDGFDLLAV